MTLNSKLVTQTEQAVHDFVAWLDRFGEVSQDHQDYYAWPIGRWCKSQYYRNKKYGTFLVAPFVFCEAFFPRTRGLFRKKTRLPIGDAHYAMAFCYMHRLTGNTPHHDRAAHFLDMLEQSRCPGYQNHAWGYPFHWETVYGTWPQGTPMITATPYCYDAFADVYAVDGDPRWRAVMESTARHVAEDFKEAELEPGVRVCSYTPGDDRRVVNANSYRAQMLTRAASELDREDYWEIAQGNLNYVLKSQSPDGSWIYATDGLGGFIDNFHTCFVLKHLARIHALKQPPGVWEAIEKGCAYYFDNLLDDDLLPIPFAKPPRLIVYKRELYDYAEAINLALLLRDQIPKWNEVLERLLQDILVRWRKPDGSLRSRELRFGWDHCPMHRWAQSQLFRALTLVLLVEQGGQRLPHSALPQGASSGVNELSESP